MFTNKSFGGHTLRIVFGMTFLEILLLAGSAGAATLTVNASGGADYARIQDAIDNVSDGDTILVYSGTYLENIIVAYKQLILKGVDTGGGKPVVDGQNIGSAITLISINNTLEGFKVVNGNKYPKGNPIEATGGILIYSDNNIIRNNSASNNGYGILVEGSNNNTLIGNDASSNGHGISLDGSNNNTLIDNDASNNAIGISLTRSFYSGYPSNNNRIIDNNAQNNYDYGISLANSSNNILKDNNMQSDYIGIFLWSSSNNNMLIKNSALNNNYGIYLQDSNNNNILVGNKASNNNYGIYLTYSSSNIIYDNSFNNTNNAYDDGNNIWNITKTAGENIIGGEWLGGNYWSDYTGKDLNGDGLGDTLLPHNNSGNILSGGDYLPLTPVSKVGGIIHGTIYNDSNRNKIRDAGEEGLTNWSIELGGFDNLTNEPVKKQINTDINGDYSFTNLNPGRYVVLELPQPKWVPTTLPARSINLTENENAAVDFGNRRA